jgi:ABC-2 type transport system permease protein
LRVFELAKRNLKEILRDRITMAFLIGMPVVLMLVFGFAFRNWEVVPLSLGVVNQDAGESSEPFVDALGGMSALDVSLYEGEPQAREALRVGNLDGVLIIPEEFSENMEHIIEGEIETHIQLELVSGEAEPGAKERLLFAINSAAISMAESLLPSGVEMPMEITDVSCYTEEIGYMNILAPGMTVFGLLILIPSSASLIARDKETMIMPRLLTTPLRPREFILGYSLPYIPLLILQVGIYLGIGCALGLKIVGNLGLAFLLLLLLGLSSIALGMIFATFIKHEGQAHVSWVLIVPMAILAGAWFPIAGMPSAMQGIAKAFPATYAITALEDVISRGLGFGAIASDFWILLGFVVGLFAIGAILFRSNMATSRT